MPPKPPPPSYQYNQSHSDDNILDRAVQVSHGGTGYDEGLSKRERAKIYDEDRKREKEAKALARNSSDNVATHKKTAASALNDGSDSRAGDIVITRGGLEGEDNDPEDGTDGFRIPKRSVTHPSNNDVAGWSISLLDSYSDSSILSYSKEKDGGFLKIVGNAVGNVGTDFVSLFKAKDLMLSEIILSQCSGNVDTISQSSHVYRLVCSQIKSKVGDAWKVNKEHFLSMFSIIDQLSEGQSIFKLDLLRK
jgi:hypothetical protein